jgi:predicted GNAT superfamily acetyltransferase
MTSLYANFSKRFSGIAAVMVGNKCAHIEYKVYNVMFFEGPEHIETFAQITRVVRAKGVGNERQSYQLRGG